jgi:hypothetical protein
MIVAIIRVGLRSYLSPKAPNISLEQGANAANEQHDGRLQIGQLPACTNRRDEKCDNEKIKIVQAQSSAKDREGCPLPRRKPVLLGKREHCDFFRGCLL